MKNKSGSSSSDFYRRAVLLAFVAAFFSTLFVLCNLYDNKYTAKSVQPFKGVLSITEDDLRQTPVLFLIWDWEIYRDKLLEPSDFGKENENIPVPDEYTFIGQFKGFEGKDQNHPPHGSATYRLRIELPPEVRSYTMELPEIYSSYKLYINGILMTQMGDPDPISYQPQTGISAVTVQASDSLEIIFAVSDFSYLYSGMIYPPAFGEAVEVSHYINSRFALRVAAISIAVCVGLIVLCVRIMIDHQRKDGKDSRLLLMYSLLCFCFVGYIGYPVVKTLFYGGLQWYYFENFCRCAMFLLIILIQYHISGIGKKTTEIFVLFALFVCCFCLVTPLFISGNLAIMIFYSRLLSTYTYTSAIFLTLSTVYGIYKSSVYSFTMLSGTIVYDCALIWWRIYPDYEPIYFGWFVELASVFFLIFIGIVTAFEIAKQYRERLLLQEQVAGTARIIEMQSTYYPVLLQKEYELKIIQHDLRHHFVIMRELAANKNIEDLIAYINEYADAMTMVPTSYCGHYAVDMLLRLYAGIAQEKQIKFSANAKLPNDLDMSNVDLCVILSNLLENAIEASEKAIDENRWIKIGLLHKYSRITIAMDNGFDGTLSINNGNFSSRKQRGRIGIGLASISTVAMKYNGFTKFYADEANPIFHSEVILELRSSNGK